jgi:hypothetical protein
MLRYLKRSYIIGFVSTIVLFSACSRETTPPIKNQPGPILFGAYVRGDSSFDEQAINQLEDDLDHTLDIVQWFGNFDDPWELYLVKKVVGRGHIPMFTWQPNNYSLDYLLSGAKDNYFREWARGARSYSGHLYIRLMPEMNGNWVSWSGNPEKYKAIWKHIVNLFQQEGATNVKWIWAPNCMDGPRDNPNYFMEKYYPGSDYVDVIGLSGFNWGNTFEDGKPFHIWRSHEDVFAEAYTRLNKISNHKFWFVETSSAEDSNDPHRKADWVKDMFTSKAFPKLEAIIWFNEKKERDWRAQSSQPTLNAFREILDVTYESRSELASLYK